jgi:hypothetical protein
MRAVDPEGATIRRNPQAARAKRVRSFFARSADLCDLCWDNRAASRLSLAEAEKR